MLHHTWIDLVFAFGTGIFLVSALPQLIKLYRVMDSSAQSLCHNELQLIAIATLIVGYFFAQANISLLVTTAQLVIRVKLILLIRQKRPMKLKYKSDLIYYTKKIWRRYHG